MYNPTRNYCDPSYLTRGDSTTSSITFPFYRPSWETDFVVQVQDRGNGSFAADSASYQGPGDPYEGPPYGGFSCYLNGAGYPLSGFYQNPDGTTYHDANGFAVAYNFRVNVCSGSSEVDPSSPADPTH